MKSLRIISFSQSMEDLSRIMTQIEDILGYSPRTFGIIREEEKYKLSMNFNESQRSNKVSVEDIERVVKHKIFLVRE